MSGAVLTTLPVIAAYIYLQKYMVEGLTAAERQRLGYVIGRAILLVVLVLLPRPAPPGWSCPPDSPPRSTSAVKGSTARGRPRRASRRSPSTSDRCLYLARDGRRYRRARSRTSGRSVSRAAAVADAGRGRAEGGSSTVRRCPILRSAPFAGPAGLLVTTYDQRSQPGRALSAVVDGRAERAGRAHTRARRVPAPEAARRAVALDPRRQSVRGRSRAQNAVRAARPRGTPAQPPVALADPPAASHRQREQTGSGSRATGKARRRGGAGAQRRGPGGGPPPPCVGRGSARSASPARTLGRGGAANARSGGRGRRREAHGRSSPRSPTVTPRGP